MRARRVLIAGVCAAGVAGIMSLGGSTGAVAQHEPANKVSAAGSTTEVISPNERVVLLSEIVKTSKPTDLILGVTAECSITTELTTVGNDFSEAMGQVKVWVEIDGKPVPVAKTDTQEPGRVVFCKDLYQRTTSMFDDEGAERGLGDAQDRGHRLPDHERQRQRPGARRRAEAHADRRAGEVGQRRRGHRARLAGRFANDRRGLYRPSSRRYSVR
jgi:hypothetical protein